MKKKIIVISGDPNSINSEIILKTWKKLNKEVKKKTYFISNSLLLKNQFKKLNSKQKIIQVKNLNDQKNCNFIKVLNLDLNFKNPFKVSKKHSSKFVNECLSLGHNLALRDDVAGIINCPIDKKLFKKKNIGVTEILASMCNVKDNSEVMLIKSKNFAVAPLTTHLDLKDVSKRINKKIIINKIKIINHWFKKFLKKKPKIGVLGLNPHNAELRDNSEEKKFIIPAIKILKKNNINVYGPLVADTVFINHYKKLDVILGMYHDQVLTPFKSIFRYDAINITLGLKYLRLSPDHGVASNLIGKNEANYESLLHCVKFLNRF